VRALFFFSGILLLRALLAQTTINLSFSGRDGADWVQLDSVRVMNLSQGGDTLLRWPDTVLSFTYMFNGPELNRNQSFGISHCYPNPSDGITSFELYIPSNDRVQVQVNDLLGRLILHRDWQLAEGNNRFQLRLPRDGVYMLSARWRDECSTEKILHQGIGESQPLLENTGFMPGGRLVKQAAGITGFGYSPGDILLICGFSGGMDKYIQDSPTTSQDYIMQFGYNVPCHDLPTFTYGGQAYTTIQIGCQCWMAGNLNVGIMVNSVPTGDSHSDVSNNGVIEKYCYNNDTANCAVYGGFYDWNEMMGYATTPGTRGICPNGWHIPTDAEWCTLTTYLDTTVNSNAYGWSGTDAGGGLKEAGIEYWISPNTGATNSSGFTAFGAGYRYYSGFFDALRYYGYFWSSSAFSPTYGISRGLTYGNASVSRDHSLKTYGFSVRCLRD